MKPKSTGIKCPSCKREGDWLAGPYGPFCSRRCKLVDLGKWFGEEHVITRSLQSDPQGPAAAFGKEQGAAEEAPIDS